MRQPRVIAALTACAVALGLGALLPGGSAGAGTGGQSPPALTTVPVGTSAGGSEGGSDNPFPHGPNVNITHKADAQSETTIAVDPTNPLRAVASSNDLGDTTIVYGTADGGRTWVDTHLNLTAFCYDPWLDFNAAGDAFFAYECSAGGTQQWIAYRKSGALSWTKIQLNAGSFPDRDMVVADNNPSSPGFGRVYVGYDDAIASNSAFVNYSPDGFGNYQKSPKINDASRTIGVNVATAPDGTVFATWEDFDGRKIWLDRSLDGGAHWGTDRVVHNYRLNTTSFFISIPPQPQRGILPWPFSVTGPEGTAHAGRLYIVYTDRALASSDTDIFLRFSDDAGATWSAEMKVNDDTVNAWQFHPSIDVAPDGTLGVSFYDTRNDLNDKKTDRFVAFSTDGGVTWTANEKVTTAMSDESGFGDPNDYGDYQGMATFGLATPTFALSWTDSRPSATAEDMFAAGARM